MRLIVQRVKHASVTVDHQIVGQILQGVLVLFACHKEDREKQIPWLAKKLVYLRLFPDPKDKMNLSVLDVQGEILIVPQFTLYANCQEGHRPSFTDAMEPLQAEKYYQLFVQEVQKFLPKKVQTGIFGANMQVELVNFGPVTLIVDAKEDFS